MWESWEDRQARERAERQEAEDTPRLAKSIWLVWATARPGVHCTYTANNAEQAELLGKVHLGYPHGGVSSTLVAGTVGGLIAAATQEGPLKIGDGVRLGHSATATVVTADPDGAWVGVADPVTGARAWIDFESDEDEDEDDDE